MVTVFCLFINFQYILNFLSAHIVPTVFCSNLFLIYFLFSILYYLLSRMIGSHAKETGYTYVSFWLQTSRGPAESNMFLKVGKSWKEIVAKVNKIPNDLKAATQCGILPNRMHRN